MLLSGGIELRVPKIGGVVGALFEQERKYMEILVGKILKVKPDVLLIVGRSVSRQARSFLAECRIVLVSRLIC
jgi:hypothetical protein